MPPSRHVPPHRCTATPPRRRAAALRACVARAMLMAALPSIMFRQGCHHQSFEPPTGNQASVLPRASGPSPKGRNGRSQRRWGGYAPQRKCPAGQPKQKDRSFGLLFWVRALSIWFYGFSVCLPSPSPTAPRASAESFSAATERQRPPFYRFLINRFARTPDNCA